MNTIKMTMHKKENNKHVAVGTVDIFVPSLEELGILGVEIKEGLDENSLLQYVDDKVQYAYNAVVSAVRANARNKIVAGTTTLKEGNKIASTVAELLEVGVRGGNGAALAFLRELKAMFAKWVATLGKPAGAQQLLTTLFTNRQALTLRNVATKEKFSDYISDFSESLDEETLEKAENYLQSLLDACSQQIDESGF